MWRVTTLCGVLFTITLAASLNNEEGRKIYVLVATKYQQGVSLTRLYRNTDELSPDWQQIAGRKSVFGEISYFAAHDSLQGSFNKTITVCNYFGSSLLTDSDDCSSLDGSATTVFSFYASAVSIPQTRKIIFAVCFDLLSNISYSVVSTQQAYCRGHNPVLTSGHFYAFVGKRFCDTPKLPSGGTIASRTYEDEIRLVSVTYQCDIGMKIRGHGTVNCHNLGIWASELPTCQGEIQAKCEALCQSVTDAIGSQALDVRFFPAVDCGRPIIENGRPSGTKFTFPARTSFNCNQGYVLSPTNAMIDCLPNGEWEGTLVECKPVSCGPPPPVPHGRTIGSIFTYPQKLKSVCDEGYKNVYGSTIKCELHGQWYGSQASCYPFSCRDPGVPTNGRRLGDNFTYGNTVRFDCNEGYALLGHGSITCGNGIWKGFKPTCEPLT